MSLRQRDRYGHAACLLPPQPARPPLPRAKLTTRSARTSLSYAHCSQPRRQMPSPTALEAAG